MNATCSTCGTALPLGAAFCPKCGKPQGAPATTTAAKAPAASAGKTPTSPPPAAGVPPGAPAAQDRGEWLRWILEQQAAFNAWRKRLKFIGIPAGIVAFVIVFAVLARTGPFAFGIAAVVGILTDMVVETEILPRFTFPTIPCPYCGGQVSIAERPQAFRRWERTRSCPHCKHELPH